MLNLLPADWYCISPVQYLPRTSRTIFQINPPGLVYWREWCQMYTVCSSANYLWIKIWNLNEILCTDPLPAELYNSFLIKSKHLILNELPRLRRWIAVSPLTQEYLSFSTFFYFQSRQFTETLCQAADAGRDLVRTVDRSLLLVKFWILVFGVVGLNSENYWTWDKKCLKRSWSQPGPTCDVDPPRARGRCMAMHSELQNLHKPTSVARPDHFTSECKSIELLKDNRHCNSYPFKSDQEPVLACWNVRLCSI